MNEQEPSERGFSDEFQKMGANIKDVAQAVLGSEEFKTFQREMNEGLSELGDTINKFFQEVAESPAGKRVKEEIDDFTKSARTGELESKVRQDVLAALHKANEELEKAAQRWRTEEETSAESPTSESGEGTPGQE